MKKNQNISLAKQGMQRDVAVDSLDEQAYILAFNMVMEEESGRMFKLKSEPSNILASKFVEGYRVVGFRNDDINDRTWFALANPTTGASLIGTIASTINIASVTDVERQCKNCELERVLGEPLETVTQVAYQTFTTVLDDSCPEAFPSQFCLNFDIRFPVSIVIKNEQLGTRVFFTDYLNPPRYFDEANIDFYKQTGSAVCETDTIVPVCVNCERLRLFPLNDQFCIVPSEVFTGGNLLLGQYSFYGAYTNVLGDEVSEYFSLTQPIDIFDENNQIITNEELEQRTGLGIKLDITDLDTQFDYYKVVVAFTNAVDSGTRYYEVGIFPSTNTAVRFVTEQDKEEISVNQILQPSNNIRLIRGFTEANDTLAGFDIVREKEINLQPIVNLMGGFLKWQTHITTEEVYQDGVNNALFKGYMRDEVYPFAIEFKFGTGRRTARFPFIARPATATDVETIDNDDKDSLDANITNCGSGVRELRWQLYNTASEEGTCEIGAIPTNTIVSPVTKTSISEEVVTVTTPNNTITITDNIALAQFTTLENYINDNFDPTTGDCIEDQPYCAFTDPSLYPDVPPTFTDCATPVQIAETLRVNTIVPETLDPSDFTYTEFSFPDDYRPMSIQPVCNMYTRKTDGDSGYLRDSGFEADYGLSNVFFRNYVFSNDRPISSLQMEFEEEPLQPLNISYFFNYLGGNANISSVQETNFTGGVVGPPPGAGNPSTYFTEINKNGLWFTVNFDNADLDGVSRQILEVTERRNPDGNDAMSNTDFVRISFFADVTGAQVALYSALIDTRDSHQYRIIKDTISDTILIEQSIDNDTPSTIISTAYTEGQVVMVLDPAIDIDTGGSNDYFVRPHDWCFGVALRRIEFESLEAEFTSISFDKLERYVADCNFEIPLVNECEAVPHKFGEFAYWESTEDYPDNKELYDSSGLTITPADFAVSGIASEFETKYTDGVSGGEYDLKDETDFTCTPIRHFKFPDNKVSPFMYEFPQVGFARTIVYPLGVTIDDNVINDFLDIAVTNGLISQEDRDHIVGYEIFRGDRTIDKGIIAKGLLYDMYQYEEDQKDILFPNFPYNDLGDNKLILTDDRNDDIAHPFAGTENYNFTFQSPDTEFFKPVIPPDLSIEGYMFGKSKGVFEEVEDHPKYVILGSDAKALATTLAILETAAEAAIIAANSAEVFRVQVGIANSANPVGIGLNVAAVALNIVGAALFKYARFRSEWLQGFRDNGTPQNFAKYYTSVGEYNFLDTLQSEGNQLRGINKSFYLKSGRATITNEIGSEVLEVNNVKREESVFITLGPDHTIEYPIDYANYDNGNTSPGSNSRFFEEETFNCSNGRSPEFQRDIASPYVALKNFLPAQYGTIDNVDWLTTSYKGDLQNPSSDCKPIFGGDIFISRHTLKRKAPLFIRTAMGNSSFTPFPYRAYSNYGTQPRFFANFMAPDEVTNDRGFPFVFTEYEFDCLTGDRDFYVTPPSKFYLYYYGIASFLTESTINLNYRIGRPEPQNLFWPIVGDYVDWTQENNVKISEPNTYFYRNVYSGQARLSVGRTLPATFSQVEFDTLADSPNGVVFSRPDTTEKSLTEPWTVFRPQDSGDFPTEYGKLIDVRGIESEQLLCRFDRTVGVFNSFTELNDTGTAAEVQNLASGLQRRPITWAITDLGYAGTQSRAMVSCEKGHFWVDAKRGQIFQLAPMPVGSRGLSQMQEISAVVNGRPSGMRNWFKEHLPFKVLNPLITNFETIDIDNPYNGIGITMGWDSRFRRVFITKKDYRPIQAMTYTDGEFFDGPTKIELTDTDYFQDVSFTVAYDTTLGAWLSYYDFEPNYYIDYNNYFQTGVNNTVDTDEFGLWSHLLTNRSYGVFYGKKYEIGFEYPIKNNYASKTLESLEVWAKGLRYHNEYDYAYDPDIAFNRLRIFNNREASGELVMFPQRTLRQNRDYPKTFPTYQEILYTNSNDRWHINYFYNRVFKERLNQPIWNWDANQIKKTFNPSLIRFKGKRVLEPLRGDFFRVHLGYDLDSRYQVEFKWATNQEDIR